MKASTGLVVNATADLLDDELTPLTQDRRFKAAWERNSNWRGTDKTAGAYEAYLAEYVLALGWEEQKVCDLLIKWRRKHGWNFESETTYYARTLAKAGAKADQARLLSSIHLDTRLAPEEALRLLSDALTVPVASIQRYKSDPPRYVLTLGKRKFAECSGHELASQKGLGGILFDYANVDMPSFKAKEWPRVKHLIICCIQDVESAAEATHLGSTANHLRTYLRRMFRHEMDQQKAAVEGKPALLNDGLWFSMDGLRRSIKLESTELPPTKAMLDMRLKQIGCAYKRHRDLRPQGESNTTRSLWRVPNDIADEVIADCRTEDDGAYKYSH